MENCVADGPRRKATFRVRAALSPSPPQITPNSHPGSGALVSCFSSVVLLSGWYCLNQACVQPLNGSLQVCRVKD